MEDDSGWNGNFALAILMQICIKLEDKQTLEKPRASLLGNFQTNCTLLFAS